MTSQSSDAVLIAALRAVCAVAPACSTEAEALNCGCRLSRACTWRDELRNAQRIARLALHEIGVPECP